MNAQIRITYRDKDGNIIENPEDGQRAYSPETQKFYQWSAAAGTWQIMDGDINFGMTAYDLNKQIISQLPILDEGALDIARSKITQFFEETKNTYYMMLCRDLNYYTLFNTTKDITLPYAMNEVIDCADYLGDIKSIELEDGKGAVEIWITQRENNKDTYVMYLFPYDAGVIKCTL